MQPGLRGVMPFLLAGSSLILQARPSPVAPVILVGAGDIASCDNDASEATTRLLDDIDGTVVVLGDNVLDHGTADEYARFYHLTWGRHRDLVTPLSLLPWPRFPRSLRS